MRRVQRFLHWATLSCKGKVWLVLFLLMFFAKGGATSEEPAGLQACDVLTVEMVQSVLEVASLDANPRPGRERAGNRKKTYTSCLMVWSSDKKVEREIAGRKMMMPAENRINLSLSIFAPGGDQGAYNTGTKYLKEKYETDSVDGIGEEALWVPKMNQLSVRGNGNVFHLSVEYPDGSKENLEYTKKLAKRILEELAKS